MTVKGSIININLPSVSEYAFIDFMRQADLFISPSGSAFTTGSTFNQLIDANGWPNNASASGQNFGGGPRIPGVDQYTREYVLTWDFDGSVQIILNGATWTETNNTGTTYTKNSNGKWTNVSGQKARVTVTMSGVYGPQLLNVVVTATGGSGGFLKNLKMCFIDDEADMNAGKIFRTTFKQLYVDYKPSAIRFMDWLCINASQLCRFEHRNVPSYAGWFNNMGCGQPAYGTTSGTNQMSLAAVSTGTFQTPGAMQHGEMVTCKIGTGMVRTGASTGGNTSKVVSGITKANPGVVSATAHGFNTGDVIIHQMCGQTPSPVPAGMTQLHNVPCTITKIDADSYSIGIDTSSGYSTFTIGTAYQYITLNVGGRGDYPVVFGDGISPASRFGADWLVTNQYKTFTFDKNVICSSTVTGAWLARQDSGNASATLQGGVPLEVCTALINELAAMGCITDMWVNIPHRGMISSDPDYSAGSNWPVNMVSAIKNGGTFGGVTYAGLDSRCNLYIEHSNETWNTGFSQCNYMEKLGYQTWPALGGADVSTYSSLRAVQSIREIKAAFPGDPRIKYVLGFQGTFGATGPNVIRFNGNTQYNAAIGDAFTPMSNFDWAAWAAYVYNDDSNATYSLATCATAWNGTANDEATFALYVAGIVSAVDHRQESIYYYTVKLADFATAAVAQGKKTIMYEGGWDHVVNDPATAKNGTAVLNGTTALSSIQNNPTLTVGNFLYGPGIPEGTTVSSSAAGSAVMSNPATLSGITNYECLSRQSAFLRNCKRSRAWANAIRAFHDAFNSVDGAVAPADYIMVNNRWGHTPGDTFAGGVEGAALDIAWQYLKYRNNNKQMLIGTI